jgi:uncharacterized protein (TIGR00730 family)
MPIRSLAVFCGSHYGSNPLYAQHAVMLGRIMAEHQVALVYGGGNVGLMGTIADTVMEHGGTVIGIIPKVLVEWERQHTNISELIVSEDMHERKRTMYSRCDAAVVLPGGFGTLDEVFEMLTWNQLSIHDKEIFILNSGGFYDHLVAHIRKMQSEQFLYEIAARRITVIDEPEEIMPFLKQD